MCDDTHGLIASGEEVLEEATEASTVRDAGRMAVIQAVKHLKIARYGTLVAGQAPCRWMTR